MPSMGTNHFEVFEGPDGQWRFRYVYSNGEIANDDYATSADARRGVYDLLEALGVDPATASVTVLPHR